MRIGGVRAPWLHVGVRGQRTRVGHQRHIIAISMAGCRVWRIDLIFDWASSAASTGRNVTRAVVAPIACV